MERTKHGHRWDAEADGVLRQLVEAGVFLPEMARQMGRSQEAIRTRANHLGVPVRSSPPRIRA